MNNSEMLSLKQKDFIKKDSQVLDRNTNDNLQKSLEDFIKSLNSFHIYGSSVADIGTFIEDGKDDTGMDTNYDNLPDSTTLNDFIDTSDIIKNDNSNSININKLLYNIKGTDILSKDDIKKLIKSLLSSGVEQPDIYNEMLDNLNVFEADYISGLSAFIAQTRSINRKTSTSIDVSSEISRNNFSISKQDFTDIKPDTNGAYDSFINARQNIHKFSVNRKLSNFIKSTCKHLDRESKFVNIEKPDWMDGINSTDDSTKLPRVLRQSNTFIVSPTMLDSDVKSVQNAFTKSLVDLLKNSTDSSWSGDKTGFTAAGLSPDAVTRISTRLKDLADFTTEVVNGKNAKEAGGIRTFDEYGLVTYNIDNLSIPRVITQPNLNEIKIPSRIYSITGKSGQGANHDSTEREKLQHSVLNMSIKALLDKAPDFRQNTYLGLFVLTTNDGGQLRSFYDIANSIGNNVEDIKNLGLSTANNGSIRTLNSAFQRIINTYYVRMQGIQVPSLDIGTYEIPFLTRKIKRVGINYNEAHKATIDFNVDEQGLMMRQFDLLTNSFSYVDNNEENNKYALNLFPLSFSKAANGSRLDLVVTYNDFRINRNYKEEDTNNRSMFLPATQDIQSENDSVWDAYGQRYIGDPRGYRQFVFEDVKILGSSSGPKFNRDSANKLTASYDIIFRRITTVDGNALY